MKKKTIFILGGIIGGLAIVYFGLALFFSSHYLFRTTISSIPCGGRKPEYIIGKNQEIAEDYLIAVEDRCGNLFGITGSEVNFTYVPTGEEEAILAQQNPFAWPISLFKPQSYELPTSVDYDYELAREAVARLGLFEEDYIVSPTDATIQLTDEGCEIIPEDNGWEPIYDMVLVAVVHGLDYQAEHVTLEDECYVTPTIYQDDPAILAARDTVSRYMASTVSYEIGEDREELTSERILSMLIVGEDFSIAVDEEKLLSFVQGLCTKYNTYADDREFVTTNGDTITIGGGDYGWVISKRGEMDQILLDLEGGEPVTREPVYEQTAAQHGANDIGNTYIEIDYTNQHLWYYQDGVLMLETDIVSGNLSTQNGSVDGVFSISYKQKNATLVGEGYSSPVSYFMPFAYNIGIHDATWRSSFGGSTYLTGGSHGCINVPYSVAEQLFSMVAVDTPVVAYYRTPVVLTNNAARVSNAYSYVEPED